MADQPRRAPAPAILRFKRRIGRARHSRLLARAAGTGPLLPDRDDHPDLRGHVVEALGTLLTNGLEVTPAAGTLGGPGVCGGDFDAFEVCGQIGCQVLRVAPDCVASRTNAARFRNSPADWLVDRTCQTGRNASKWLSQARIIRLDT